MIQSSKNSLTEEVQSLGTLLGSSDRFTKVRIKVTSGGVRVGDSALTAENEAGLAVLSTDGIVLFEFDWRDDPATNLFISTNSSATITILAY